MFSYTSDERMLPPSSYTDVSCVPGANSYIWRMDKNKEDGAKSMDGIACVIVSNTMLYFNIMMSVIIL